MIIAGKVGTKGNSCKNVRHGKPVLDKGFKRLLANVAQMHKMYANGNPAGKCSRGEVPF
jgi:hypothetical protein